MFFNNKKKIRKRREMLCNEAEIFIQVHFVRERGGDRCKFNTLPLKSDPEIDKVEKWYDKHDNPSKYSEIAFAYFKDTGKDEDSICSKILLEKNYFTKLKNSLNYIPSKGEAITVCFAFKLSFEAAKVLLKSADYAITNSDKTDLIIRYFLEIKNHSINDLNHVLNKICGIKLRDVR